MSLYERAVALLSPAELDVMLETQLIHALFRAGQRGEAIRRADSIAERAASVGDELAELCGRLQAGVVGMDFEPEGAGQRLAALVEQALPVFRAAGDDLALYIAYMARAFVVGIRAKADAELEAYERATAHARQAGLPYEPLDGRAAARFYGTTPVPALLMWLDEHEPRDGYHHWSLRTYRARALAMLGRFDEARGILAEVRAELAERGGGMQFEWSVEFAEVELLAGDAAAAGELGAEGCRLIEEGGSKGFLSTAAGKLAQTLYALDRLEEANAWAGRAAELGASDDAYTQMLWRQVQAKLLARRGDLAQAERLARRGGRDRRGDRHAQRTGRGVRRLRRGAPPRREVQ